MELQEMFERHNLIQSVRISQLGECMCRHTVDVFGTMLGLPAAKSERFQNPSFPKGITGFAGFAGETVSGGVGVHFSEAFARCATAAMLGLKPDDLIGPAEINDVVGELTNLLTGGIRSWLREIGISCATSTAIIIRGKSFAIEQTPGVEREILTFECAGEFVIVEIHLKGI